MPLIELSISIFIILYVINYSIKNVDFFLDNKKTSSHKTFVDKVTTPPFSGGILALFSLLILIPNDLINFKIIIFLIFMIGFLSDTNILKSVNLRFIIQIIIVFFAVIILEKYIQNIRLRGVDLLLDNYFFKLFFTSFCILILINGTNFIDGLNTVVSGYYLLIIFFISSFFEGKDFFILNYEIIVCFAVVLASILILNAFNLLYLGDNGAYLLSFFIGIILIDLSNNNESITPYYIANLLWYPAYENLFSIIRKSKNKKSILKPDNKHLHQLIYLFIKEKLEFDVKIINTISGVIINLFNLFIFAFATQNYSNTKYQLIIMCISLIVYNSTYILLMRKYKHKYFRNNDR